MNERGSFQSFILCCSECRSNRGFYAGLTSPPPENSLSFNPPMLRNKHGPRKPPQINHESGSHCFGSAVKSGF